MEKFARAIILIKIKYWKIKKNMKFMLDRYYMYSYVQPLYNMHLYFAVVCYFVKAKKIDKKVKKKMNSLIQIKFLIHSSQKVMINIK